MAVSTQKKTAIKFNPVPELAKASSGIGLRAPHFQCVLDEKPDIGWLEIHSENFFSPGGIPQQYLEKIRPFYPLSFHGIGLSLGSSCGVDNHHLAQLKALVDAFEPKLVSDHLSWSADNTRAAPDLLPLPLTREAFEIFRINIDRVQDRLRRPILVENPSAYVSFDERDMKETEFLTELARKTGCGLLIDINNIHVSTHNLGGDARRYIHEIPPELVGEIHLAGYQINQVGGHEVYIDAHNNPVYAPVWELYEFALENFGDAPTLIEWDNDLPSLARLVEEARKADSLRTLYAAQPSLKEGTNDCA